MLHRPKALSNYVSTTRVIFQRHSLLQQLRAKSGLRYNSSDEDEDDDKLGSENDKQEGHIHLFKSRGQHILTNPRVLDSIVRKSDIKPTDTVLEIGPGTGNLTLRLLRAAQKVVAVEIDKRMIEILWKRAAEEGVEDRLTVMCYDALKTDFPPFDLVVANIPYGISSPIVAKLVFGTHPFRIATLLLQKEFAKRLLAKPGDSEYNRLAVNVRLVADVEFVMDVSKRDFVPIPKVDSSVVKIFPKAEIPNVNLEEWWAFTRTCFSKKNRTLGATLKQKSKLMELWELSNMTSLDEENFANDKNYVCGDEDGKWVSHGDCFASSGLEPGMSLFKERIVEVLRAGRFEDKRPSKLSNVELLHLLSLFNQAGIYFHDKARSREPDNLAY